jgi:hypothetical protein
MRHGRVCEERRQETWKSVCGQEEHTIKHGMNRRRGITEHGRRILETMERDMEGGICHGRT